MLKKVLALVLVVFLAVGAAWGVIAATGGDDEPAASEKSAAGVPDVPDVVAEVNGEEIPEEDFVEAYQAREQALAQQAQQGAEQPGEAELTEQVVQSLVNEELLSQEAERREIDPTDKQVQATLTELAGQSGMSADQLVEALEKQGLAREEIDEQATLQTRFDLLVADEVGAVSASDKEIRALYEQLSQQSGGKGGGQQVPPLKQVRPQLEAQVASQKESEAARALIDQLREDADITVHV